MGRLRRDRLHGVHFRRQQIIDGFIFDFYCASAGLIIEVDGGIHAEQAEADAEREQVLTARGLRVVRFTNEQVFSDLGSVLTSIEAFL